MATRCCSLAQFAGTDDLPAPSSPRAPAPPAPWFPSLPSHAVRDKGEADILERCEGGDQINDWNTKPPFAVPESGPFVGLSFVKSISSQRI